jgi:hypothetical protein
VIPMMTPMTMMEPMMEKRTGRRTASVGDRVTVATVGPSSVTEITNVAQVDDGPQVNPA